MLYVKHITKKSKEKFYPIQDDNVYVFCERCGKMIYILEPGGFLYEYGGCSDTIEDIDLCDECYDRKCRIEDDYLKARKAAFMEDKGVEDINVKGGGEV